MGIKIVAISTDRNQWMITYAALLTAVLAFFILFITIGKKSKSQFKSADMLNIMVFKKITQEKKEKGLDWLFVENTGTKGVKLLVPSIVDGKPFFESGKDKIAQSFVKYFQSIADVIKAIGIDTILDEVGEVNPYLMKSGKKISLNITVEGHTDTTPITSPLFGDNWQLSIARAYEVMQFLKKELKLHKKYFSIGGYGPFHPLNKVENYDENRRVEIYINFQLVNYNGGIQESF